MAIINLTQHRATPEQLAQGVIDLPERARDELSALLTFESIPTMGEMRERASAIAKLACQNGLGESDDPHPTSAMIGGAPFFMSVLESTLRDAGIEPVYAFSKRESIDMPQDDGTVKKVAVFRHIGFVKVA